MKVFTFVIVSSLFSDRDVRLSEALRSENRKRTSSVIKKQRRSLLMESLEKRVVFASGDLLVSEFLANPASSDGPFEYVELVATRAINFATTPYSVVWANNGTATTNGWIAGGGTTYGFNISTGSVIAGDVVYVGGSSMAPTETKLRTITTSTTAGDTFGTSGGIAGNLGNGGANSDAIAVFDVAASEITSTTVPIDANFFGTGNGTAVVTGGTAGYQLPVNDRYSGGKLQAASFLAPDPASGQVTIATGTYDVGANT